MRLLPQILLSLAVAAFASAALSAEIQLRAKCEPQGPIVRLGDLADIYDVTAERKQALAAMEMFPSPAPGQQRTVRVRELQDLFALRQMNPAEHRLSGSSVVTIVGRREEAAPVAPAVRAQKQVQPVEAPLVVVATVPLARGQIVSESDVELRPTPSVSDAATSFRSIEEVIGRETTRAVPAGAALDRSGVRSPLLVRRGEVVTIDVRSAGVRIRVTAKAKDDGGEGDLITVESLLDRKTFAARVTGHQRAEVYARALQASAADQQANGR